jgi:hypothetical protein
VAHRLSWAFALLAAIALLVGCGGDTTREVGHQGGAGAAAQADGTGGSALTEENTGGSAGGSSGTAASAGSEDVTGGGAGTVGTGGTGGTAGAAGTSTGLAGAAGSGQTECPPAGARWWSQCNNDGETCYNGTVSCICGGLPTPEDGPRWECVALPAECPWEPPTDESTCGDQDFSCDYMHVMISCNCVATTWYCAELDF